MAKAVIFDYGVGNLLSLKTALEKVGLEASIGTSAKDLARSRRDCFARRRSLSAQPPSKLDSVKETLATKSKKVRRFLAYAWVCSFSLRKARKDQETV